MLEHVIPYILVWESWHPINHEAVYEKCKLFQIRLYKYNTSITCSKLQHISYNLIFATKFNDSSISITTISWTILDFSLVNEYIGDVTIPTQVIKYNQCWSRRISQSDISIHIKLNYCSISQPQNQSFILNVTSYNECTNVTNMYVRGIHFVFIYNFSIGFCGMFPLYFINFKHH